MVQEPGLTYPLSKEVAVTQILKEAQFVVSGMIYGFDFVFTPSDTARGVAELFDLKATAEIKWGDPRLTVLDTRIENNRLIAHVIYNLAPFQESWKSGWDSNLFPASTGTGTGNYYLGLSEKLASYRNAIKEAVRGYLRDRVYNKPKEIRGQAVLRDEPHTITDSGKYITTLDVKLKIDRVTPYSVY